VSGAFVVGVAAGLLYSWVATSLRPFTWPQRVMTGAAAIAILGLGAWHAGPRLSLSGWWVDWRRLLHREADPAKRDERRLRWRLGSAVWGSSQPSAATRPGSSPTCCGWRWASGSRGGDMGAKAITLTIWRCWAAPPWSPS
jgi:hypothetical protein